VVSPFAHALDGNKQEEAMASNPIQITHTNTPIAFFKIVFLQLTRK
jgi:hypothetical protein